MTVPNGNGTEKSGKNGGERIWKWIMRACAVAGFGVLIIAKGLAAPTSFYVLLIGLFFGPEILTGKLHLFVKQDEDKK